MISSLISSYLSNNCNCSVIQCDGNKAYIKVTGLVSVFTAMVLIYSEAFHGFWEGL